MFKEYIILLSRDLKNKKLNTPHLPPPTTHKIKKKSLGTKVRITYKKIKYTPSRQASHLLPQR